MFETARTGTGVLLLARKELTEVLRDRRSLFVLLLLPVLLYPLLFLGMGFLATAQLRKLAARAHPVWVEDLERAPPELLELLRAPPPAGGASPFRLELSAPPPDADLDRALSERRVAVVIRGAGAAEAAAARGEEAELQLLYHSGIDTSLQVRGRVMDSVNRWSQAVARRRLGQAGLPESTLAPVRAALRDRGPPGAVAARLLAALVVMLSLTGAFYPALDMGAGEKERGTLETLLLAPVPRLSVALGKLLAVATVASVSTLLHLFSLGLTFSTMSRFAPAGTEALALGPGTLLAALVVLLPLVVLFSALALALSSFAASYKEGNAYLTPLLLVGTCAPLAAALPGMRLEAATCLVPGVSAALLLRELMAATAGWGQVLLVLGATAVWAALAVRWTASLYEQEEVLLRPVAAPGPDLLGMRARRASPRAEGRVPTLPQALALALLVVGLLTMIGPDLQARHLVGGVLTTLLLLVLMPTLCYTRLLGCDPRATLGLTPPRPLALGLAPLLAAGLLLLGPDLTALQTQLTGPLTPDEQRELARQGAALERLHPLALLGLLALLPAVTEELLFRGFVLRGLRQAAGPTPALLGSACLFALAHLDPGRLLLTLLAGLLLGGLALRGASVWPAILLHALHNGSAMLLSDAPSLVAWRADQPWQVRACGLLALGLGVGLLLWPAGRTSSPPSASLP